MTLDDSQYPLVLDDVSKIFGSFVAVDNVKLKILPGEIFALLGPNGAGKTTLISCVAGSARQTSGSIRVFGHDTVGAYRQSRSLVGLVPQEINFDPFFTPLESLTIQMGLMGVPPNKDWADELLELMKLSDKRDAYTRTLSGGMKRRLLVAKALVHKPRLLFLDEPTAGVDVELRKDLWGIVKRLRDEGTTIILTTHYLEEAEQLADRVGIIHRGQLMLVEEKEHLMSRLGESSIRLRFAAPVNSPPSSWVAIKNDTFDVPNPDASAMQRAMIDASTLGDVVSVEVRRPSLEEIFVQLIHSAEDGE